VELTKKLMERVEKNPLFKRYIEAGVKENLFSDMAGALGYMHDKVVRCAYPELIGRNIITSRLTKEPVEKFPIDSKAVAYNYAEGAVTRLSGKKNAVITVSTDILAEASELFTREFVEDATWNAMENVVEKISKALGEEETSKVLSLYGSVADEDLASGTPIDQGNKVMDWKAVIKLYDAVRGVNQRPNVLVMHETQLHQLLDDNKFIEYEYLPSSEVDLEQGSIRKIVGMNVQSSTLVPNGTAYAIDARVAGIMLIRRDVTVEDWSDPVEGEYGIRATTRFGLGVLRSNAIAKMVNIKTSL
jgi:HK97 family phage major capsid protein